MFDASSTVLEAISKVITDKGIPSEYKKLFSERSIEVIIAP